MKKLIIASTSTLHEGSYLEYLLPELKEFFAGVENVLFIPFARPGGITHGDYTSRVAEAFAKIGISVTGLHKYPDQTIAIQNASGIFTGGGNTFLLVSELHRLNLMKPLSEVILRGTPYLGTSAGSNIAGLSMKTTNDMPIIQPLSFETLGILPFNINPHYIDSDRLEGHMGETRETRIREFHVFNDVPVIGVREGSWLTVDGDAIILKGNLSARLFLKGKDAVEIDPGADVLKTINSIK